MVIVEADVRSCSAQRTSKLFFLMPITHYNSRLMQTALPITDRALHAALSPSLTTLPALLPLCRSWEDHLWARLSALIGDCIEGKMKESAGGFWNRGNLLDRLALLEQVEEDIKPEFRQDTEWEADIGHQLDELADFAVETQYAFAMFFFRHLTLPSVCRTKTFCDALSLASFDRG